MPQGDARTDGAGAGAKRGTVLVVDDDPHLRQIVRWALEDEGLSVSTAADGRDALDEATRSQPALVILDFGLPHVEGDRIAAQLRSVCGDGLPILLVTADGRAQEKAALTGAYAYLHKPFEMDELLNLVRTRIGRTQRN